MIGDDARPRGLRALARLAALLALDALWLAPLQATDDPGAVSQSITDYFALRPGFGTPEDLRTLAREAHARGIRVLLDCVPNHTAVGHPHHRDAEARGRASPWWGWYDRDPQANVTNKFDWKHLANLEEGRTGELGHAAWEHVFDDLSRVGPALDAALASTATPMPRVARFLDTNDTGERLVTRHGVATTRVAAVLLHALPGIAVVYTGDEGGAELEPYEDGPPIAWTDAHGLRPLYRKLASLRETLPALRRGAYRRVAVPGHPEAFAFLRDAGREGRALVVLNFGGAARLRLAVPPGGAAPGRDAIAEREVAVRRAPDGLLEVDAPEKSAFILVDRAPAAR